MKSKIYIYIIVECINENIDWTTSIELISQISLPSNAEDENENKRNAEEIKWIPTEWFKHYPNWLVSSVFLWFCFRSYSQLKLMIDSTCKPFFFHLWTERNETCIDQWTRMKEETIFVFRWWWRQEMIPKNEMSFQIWLSTLKILLISFLRFNIEKN